MPINDKQTVNENANNNNNNLNEISLLTKSQLQQVLIHLLNVSHLKIEEFQFHVT